MDQFITDDTGASFSLVDVKLIAFMDLDGTLTDGTVCYDGETVSRRFNVQDGRSINEAKTVGILPIIVTSSPLTMDIVKRANWLNIPLYSAYKTNVNKSLLPIVRDALAGDFITAHIGDDINDLILLNMVNFSFVPSNVNPSISLNESTERLLSSGGMGAVRDYMNYLINVIFLLPFKE